MNFNRLGSGDHIRFWDRELNGYDEFKTPRLDQRHQTSLKPRGPCAVVHAGPTY